VVNVEVADCDVAVVEVVMVDVEFVVVGVAAIAGGAKKKKNAMCMTELQSCSRRFAPEEVPSEARFVP
jgi:hypothetical protein